MIKRVFDILLAVVAVALLLVPIILIAVLVRMTSKGQLCWSRRVGAAVHS